MFCLSRDKPIHLPSDELDTPDEHLEAVYAERDEKTAAALVPAPPTDAEMQERLRSLRAEINDAKLDWYIVPSEDEHQSEIVAVSEQRRAWISGFDGSAGTVLVPSSAVDAKATLFVDSRYWKLAEDAVPKKNWQVRRVGAQGGSGRDDVVGGWIEFLTHELDDGARVGIDPRLISNNLASTIRIQLESTSTKLVPVKHNLVDKVHAPSARPLGQLSPYPVALSGETTKSKLARMRDVLASRAGTEEWIYLLPTLTTIAWLLNYRCPGDIPYCPVAFAYAVLTPKQCVIFVDKRKVTDDELVNGWKEDGVSVHDYGVDEVGTFVREAVTNVQSRKDKTKVRVLASKESNWALIKACEPTPVTTIACPIDDAKALKNDVELQNFRNAYLRDGRAMVRWFAWLEQKMLKEGKDIGEWAAAAVLTRFRKQEDMYAGLAYGDISATGPNAANPHYEPSRGHESIIDPDTPYVIDAGPQYLDATIDTTRTWFLGKTPSDDVKRQYTRVLQGHIAVANQTFPRGTDAFGQATLSKKFLWEDGLDYGHGLGHGVGNYSSVHESPVGFVRGFSFKPGHVTSIEPGFYLEGQWGMRIESVYICKEVETKYEFGGSRWLGWECATKVPIDTHMVDWNLTTKAEIRWLNAHNTAVKDALMPLLEDDLDKDARDWLNRVCKPKTIFPWTGA